jgi:hypothetical protein
MSEATDENDNWVVLLVIVVIIVAVLALCAAVIRHRHRHQARINLGIHEFTKQNTVNNPTFEPRRIGVVNYVVPMADDGNKGGEVVVQGMNNPDPAPDGEKGPVYEGADNLNQTHNVANDGQRDGDDDEDALYEPVGKGAGQRRVTGQDNGLVANEVLSRYGMWSSEPVDYEEVIKATTTFSGPSGFMDLMANHDAYELTMAKEADAKEGQPNYNASSGSGSGSYSMAIDVDLSVGATGHGYGVATEMTKPVHTRNATYQGARATKYESLHSHPGHTRNRAACTKGPGLYHRLYQGPGAINAFLRANVMYHGPSSFSLLAEVGEYGVPLERADAAIYSVADPVPEECEGAQVPDSGNADDDATDYIAVGIAEQISGAYLDVTGVNDNSVLGSKSPQFRPGIEIIDSAV